MNIWTIPAASPFFKSLIEGLLDHADQDVERLANYQILLPTRRACRNLHQAFLQYFDGTIHLMPDIRALGDIDADEISLKASSADMAEAFMALPAAIEPIRRQFILADIIFKHAKLAPSFDQAMALATSLGSFMDEMITEGVDFDALDEIVPDQYSEHWQKTLHFLTLLSKDWPDWLEKNALVEQAERRNLLLEKTATLWADKPPSNPVFIAGVTGSIPAAATLMQVVANMPQGGVVLPGFDQGLDDQSWQVLKADHPQHSFKTLLKQMGITRDQISLWPSVKNKAPRTEKLEQIIREAMRPAQTSQHWFDLAKDEDPIPLRFSLVECGTLDEEAHTITTIARHHLESSGQKICIVTPNRQLARRVSAAIKRYDIEIDDSAGIPLHNTAIGLWLLLLAELAENNFDPVTMLAFLRHKLCAIGLEKEINPFERDILRDMVFVENDDQSWFERWDDSDQAPDFIKELHDRVKDLRALLQDKSAPFESIIEAHLRLAEWAGPKDATIDEQSKDGNSTKSLLWAGDDGEMAANFFANLLQSLDSLAESQKPHLEGGRDQYSTILRAMMSGATVRPKYGRHPRVQILGLMEARLMDADIYILGGLNEGTWPPEPKADPFLSRHMRLTAGLPSPDKMIGMAAHDFTQALGRDVPCYLTRALKEGGAPTRPARWLVRMETVLSKMGYRLPGDKFYNDLAKRLDLNDTPSPIARPQANPPLDARPTKLSVSSIRQWMRDPYGLYAAKILRLKKLNPLKKKADAADKGRFLHACLERFVHDYPDQLDDQALPHLLNIAKEKLPDFCPDETIRPFWMNRFKEIAGPLLEKEYAWRKSHKPLLIEKEGIYHCRGANDDKAPFAVTARADRIDSNRSERAIGIIDYKTGSLPTFDHIALGLEPQLTLEALIALRGGFENVDEGTLADKLEYWMVSKPDEISKTKSFPGSKQKQSLEDYVIEAETGLLNLIDAFCNDETGYIAIPDEQYAPSYNDYEHLERVLEWGVGEEDAS